MGIFKDNAPRLWAAGLPAIPLRAGFKRPAINAWQVFGDRQPTEQEQQDWLIQWGDGNIGLPMGPASGLVAIDLDSDDPRVIHVIESFLPKSPWKRIGRKGAVFIYRFEGERTFRIKGADGAMIMECLSKGTQIVLPPSIHPDTLQPYTANCDILEVIKSVPALPRNVEVLLREALKSAGIPVSLSGNTKIGSVVPAGARDSALVYHAGLLARVVQKGERTLVEAMGEIKQWVENYTEKVVGDEMSVEKAQLKVVEFLMRDVLGEKRKGLPMGWDTGLTDEDKAGLGIVIDDTAEIWEADRILQFIAAEFQRFQDPATAGWVNSIEVALDRVARNAGMSVLEESRILKFMVDQSKGTYTLASMRKQLAVLRAGEMAGTDHSEIARAMITDISRYGELRHAQGGFWQWKGAAWEPLDQTILYKHISDEYGKLPSAKRYSDHSQIIKLMAGLITDPLVSQKVVGVNFANGFLTEDMELVPHNASFGCTYVLPYRYQEDTHCPLFMQMLGDSWASQSDYGDKVMALQEALAATLMGIAPKFQRAFCMIGQAHSGKSRVIEILKGLMPDGCHSAVSPSDWGDKFMPAQMVGKLLNLAGEISEKREISGEVFKQIVEGAEIEAQFKNAQIFRFRPFCAQWFASNHIPKTKDTSDGFNRRWLFLEFPHRIDESKKVVDIDQIILAAEREQIVAWAMQSLGRLKQNKDYTMPSSHRTMVDEMANSNNSVRYFLSQSPRLKVGRPEHAGASQTSTTGDLLFDEYWSFCAMAGGVQRVPRTRFHTLMKELAGNFNFEQKIETGRGGKDTVYRFITLVNAVK